MNRSVPAVLGLVLGYAADRAFGDPAAFHPVAGFGRVASALEDKIYLDSRSRGITYATVLVGAAAGIGLLLERATSDRAVVRSLVTATATWAVLGGTSLSREARAVHAHVHDGDLPAARHRLTHLVGRDTSQLDESAIARATIESVAENTSDAVVAPLVLGALFGVPGLLGYRAANTLDAMVGHHSERYEHFGWASARLDDLLNLAGARVSALLAAALAPTVGGSTLMALEAWHRDARHHPSPNAGPVEASFAGALDVQLGGTNIYGTRTEVRHLLGGGRRPTPADIASAVRLADGVSRGSIAVAVALAVLPRLTGRPWITRLGGRGPRQLPQQRH